MGNLKQTCLGAVCICLWHIPNEPLHRHSWLWNLLLSSATGVHFLSRKDKPPPCSPYPSWKYRNFEKQLNFQKFQLKWKILKHFTRPKQRTVLRKFFSPPPGKIFSLLWNKNLLTEIYRNIQAFAFLVLRERSSWAPRNDEMTQLKCFFWHQPELCLLESL